MEPKTLKQIAQFIAKTEGHASPDKLFQQLRGAANRNLMKEADNKGPKAGFRYSAREMLSARILLAAICSGIHSSALAEIYNDMRIESRKIWAVGADVTLSSGEAISAALDKNRADEEWRLEIVHLRDRSNGEVNHGTVWIKDGNRFDYSDPLGKDSQVIGNVIEGSTTIPVTNLLLPLVRAIRGAAEPK